MKEILRKIDAENSMWTDTNLYNELGIPAVKFGIGAALRPGPDGELHNMARLRDSTSIEDLLRATKPTPWQPCKYVASRNYLGGIHPSLHLLIFFELPVLATVEPFKAAA